MDRNHVWKILTKEVESVIVHPLVEIVGMGRVLIEHHNGIIDYQPECICVRMDYGMLKICGNTADNAMIDLFKNAVNSAFKEVKI